MRGDQDKPEMTKKIGEEHKKQQKRKKQKKE